MKKHNKKFDKNKYKEVTFTISIDSEKEERSAKRLLSTHGDCYYIYCQDCLFSGDNIACCAPAARERVGLLREMGVKLK